MENHKWYLLIGQQCEVGKSKGYINGVYQTHEDGLLIDTNACESLVDPKEVTPLLRKVESMTGEEAAMWHDNFIMDMLDNSEGNLTYEFEKICHFLKIGVWPFPEDFKTGEIKEI